MKRGSLDCIRNGITEGPFILFVGYNNEPSTARNFVCDSLHPLPDNAGTSVSSFFLWLLRSYIQSSEMTHVFAWERKTLQFLQKMKGEGCDLAYQFHIHNCLLDFHGWINAANCETGFLSMIKKHMPDDRRDIKVVIDSLSNPLFTLGYNYCVQELHKLIHSSSEGGPRIRQVLCLVHSDVLPGGLSSLSYLKHLATTVVEMRNQRAYTTHCLTGGNVQRSEELYSVSSDGGATIRPISSTQFVKYGCIEEKASTLPQDFASFRVLLSEKEKQDRDKVVLPYTRSTEKSEEEGGGKVFYQPEVIDDWDDEDPDNDLDI